MLTKSRSNSQSLAVIFFVLIVLLIVVLLNEGGGANAETTSLFAKTASNAPKSYAADKGDLLGINANDKVKIVNSARFEGLLAAAKAAPRLRKMVDLTKDPETNDMQVLLNTWTPGSFSPVHRHGEYGEAFVVLRGALAFFTFSEEGEPRCTVLNGQSEGGDKAIIVEKGTWHAMTALPPHSAVIFEISGHRFDAKKKTKELAPFAPAGTSGGLDGDAEYFKTKLLPLCEKVSQ